MRIEDLLAHIEGATVVGTATNGIEAVERIRTLKPDLVFLDVQMPGKVRSIPVEQIDYIVADGPYAELHTGDRRHVIRESMQTLEDRLDPKKFMRVHRSMIVRLDLVDTLHRGAGGDYEVQLKNGARVKVSRSRREDLERWLGVSS